MKKLKFLTVLLIAVGALNISNVKANEVIEGRNVTMTKEEYENLRSQGFSDFDVLNISESEFNRLKDLSKILQNNLSNIKILYSNSKANNRRNNKRRIWFNRWSSSQRFY